MRAFAVLTVAFALSLPLAAQNFASAAYTVPSSGTPVRSLSSATLEASPISQLIGNGRALLIVAPNSTAPALRQQMRFLDRHELELTNRNTVLVPLVGRHDGPDDIFAGENLRAGSDTEQLAMRQRFGLKATDFAVIVLDKDGNEEFRSTRPLTIMDLTARMDGALPAATLQNAQFNER